VLTWCQHQQSLLKPCTPFVNLSYKKIVLASYTVIRLVLCRVDDKHSAADDAAQLRQMEQEAEERRKALQEQLQREKEEQRKMLQEQFEKEKEEQTRLFKEQMEKEKEAQRKLLMEIMEKEREEQRRKLLEQKEVS